MPRPDDEPDREEREGSRVPAGRAARTARVGGLVVGQGLRWAGMRTANRVRTPERAAEAENERAVALINELVDQLGKMRGAAMKVGQMLSLAEIEIEGLPDEQRQELEAKLASLREDVPPQPFSQLERMLRKELGSPVQQVFAEFEPQAFAAASIGQVHRATTRDGRPVAVKVQYPRVAEAVDTDLRNATLLLPLLRRLAPGLDTDALFAELRERIGEELDYELEAQHQRRIARRLRGHPFITVPSVDTALSTRRVLVTEYVEGERFTAVRELAEPDRDRYGEIVFRFFFGLLYRDGIALGDPHPGNYLLQPDGRVAFLDFGLLRDLDGSRIDAERAIAAAVAARDADAAKAALIAGGYLPADRAGNVDASLALKMMYRATRWYAVPGEHRFRQSDPERRERRRREREVAQHAAAERDSPHPEREQRRPGGREQVQHFTLPPETILIRRMHALVASVLVRLGAGADWGAIAAEYLHGAAPATAIGQAEAEFFAGRAGVRAGGSGRSSP